jgi:CheY-like chemotaxis protein
MRIVVVDDDLDLLAETCECLTLCNYAVSPHASALEAMAFMQMNEFDLLLSDVEMPDMTGIELAAWLHDQGTASPVILTSGSKVDPRDLRGNWLFIPKPFDLMAIKGAIEAHPAFGLDPAAPLAKVITKICHPVDAVHCHPSGPAGIVCITALIGKEINPTGFQQ